MHAKAVNLECKANVLETNLSGVITGLNLQSLLSYKGLAKCQCDLGPLAIVGLECVLPSFLPECGLKALDDCTESKLMIRQKSSTELQYLKEVSCL